MSTSSMDSHTTSDRSLHRTDEPRARRALLAKLRHDLRTPINAIIGYSEILMEDAEENANESLLADVRKIHSAGRDLLTTVNEVLANERISSGELDVDIQEVAAKLHYELRTPTDVVLGYSELLLEETRAGTYDEIAADLEKIHAAAHKFLDVITDIVRFTLAGENLDGLQPGSSAEALVAAAVRTIQPMVETRPMQVGGGEILVVDDNPINRDILRQRLGRQGHHVMAAENGMRALALLEERAFDLILLDILMPEMNGYQVLQEIKTHPKWREVPVIMISALDELDSVVHCIELGADDYLPKPFNPVLLQARIESSLEKKRLRDQQRALFRKFATDEVVEELTAEGFALGGKEVVATAMFSDIRSFTSIAEAQSPAETIALLNSYFGHVMQAISSEGGIVNQMVGDGLMAIFGAPRPRADHRARAVRAALKMIERIEQFNQEQVAAGKRPIQIGIGIASGPVIAGYTGTELRATYTCVGDTVNRAARLEAHTKVVGERILMDEATRMALDGSFPVVEQGVVTLKGKAQAIKVFSVGTTL